MVLLNARDPRVLPLPEKQAAQTRVQGDKSLFLHRKKSRESFMASKCCSSQCVYAQQL